MNWLWIAPSVALAALAVRVIVAWRRSENMQMPSPGEGREWEEEPDPRWARRKRFTVALIGPDRYVRMIKRLEPPEPMQPEDRCPWVTALGGDRCERRAGHRGACVTTRTIRSAATGDVLDTITSQWWGINYKVGRN